MSVSSGGTGTHRLQVSILITSDFIGGGSTVNPLLQGIGKVSEGVGRFKNHARSFYFSVLLSAYACPTCGSRLQMIGPSFCQCECGAKFDPTVQFQVSDCCAAGLVRTHKRYVCRRCLKTVPSRFLFDENIFDNSYFCTRMRESRERKRRRREEIRRLLAGSRSSDLRLTHLPVLSSTLEADLNEFLGSLGEIRVTDFVGHCSFVMADYRRAILNDIPSDCRILFSAIPPVGQDRKLDRVRKFITLIFMEQDEEVGLTQWGDDIMVERYEADAEGC